MSRATPALREFAVRLTALERQAAPAPQPGAYLVCEKLRPHLSTLMGKAGFRAVLSRALAVAAAQAPCLAILEVRADGSLDGWHRAEDPASQQTLSEHEALLVAQLLGLLVAFIGASLTMRLVREVWPKLSREDSQLTQDIIHEEA